MVRFIIISLVTVTVALRLRKEVISGSEHKTERGSAIAQGQRDGRDEQGHSVSDEQSLRASDGERLVEKATYVKLRDGAWERGYVSGKGKDYGNADAYNQGVKAAQDVKNMNKNALKPYLIASYKSDWKAGFDFLETSRGPT